MSAFAPKAQVDAICHGFQIAGADKRVDQLFRSRTPLIDRIADEASRELRICAACIHGKPNKKESVTASWVVGSLCAHMSVAAKTICTKAAVAEVGRVIRLMRRMRNFYWARLELSLQQTVFGYETSTLESYTSRLLTQYTQQGHIEIAEENVLGIITAPLRGNTLEA